MAATKDVYIQFDGFKGESTSKTNKEWTEVKSISGGVLQATSGASTGSQSSSKVTVLPVSLSTQMDSVYCPLQKAATSGAHIKAATIQFRRSTGEGNTVVYHEIDLSDVMVTGLHLALAEDSTNAFPTSHFELSFGSIKHTYTKYDAAGKSQGNLTTTYSAEDNTTS